MRVFISAEELTVRRGWNSEFVDGLLCDHSGGSRAVGCWSHVAVSAAVPLHQDTCSIQRHEPTENMTPINCDCFLNGLNLVCDTANLKRQEHFVFDIFNHETIKKCTTLVGLNGFLLLLITNP